MGRYFFRLISHDRAIFEKGNEVMVLYIGGAVFIAALARLWLTWRALLRQLPDQPQHLVLF